MRHPVIFVLLAASIAVPEAATLAAPIGAVGRLGGVVKDEQGKPVGGFELTITPAGDQGGRPRKVKVDSKGEFLVAFFPSGVFRLEASTPAGFVRSMTYVLRDDSGNEEERKQADTDPAAGLPTFRVVSGYRVELGIVMAPEAYRQQLARRHDLAEASGSLKTATELFSGGEMEGALREVDRLLAEKPGLGAAYYLRGMALGRLGRMDEAEASLRKARELDPEQAGVDGALGTVLVQRADALQKERRADEARRLADEAVLLLDGALGKEPGSVPLLTNRVAALEAASRHAELVPAYESLAAAKPGDPAPLLKLADLHLGAGRLAEALGALERIPRSRREVAPIVYNRAAERFNSGKTDEAIRLAALGLEFDPGLAPLYRILARAHLARGENAEAITDLKRFLELAPNDPDAATEREMLRHLEKGGK